MAKRKEAAWKTAYRERIQAMTNEQLWTEFLDRRDESVYSGAYSPKVDFRADVSQTEMERRLRADSFLPYA